MTQTLSTALAETPIEEAALEPIRALWAAVSESAPTVLSAALLFGVMWLLGRVARSLSERLLGLSRLDAATKQTRLQTILDAFGEELSASKAISSLIYWSFLLLATMAAADLLGLEALSEALAQALAFVPRLLGALLVFGAGGYIAAGARRAAGAMLESMRSPYRAPVEVGTELGLLVITAAITVDVLGLDISFITANITVLFGVGLATVAFLMCWSLRKPAEEIIANYYLRRLLNPGDEVEFGGARGTVERFTPIGVLIREPQGGERFVPARHVLDGLSCARRSEAKSERARGSNE